jgi:NADH-quinone oxidoreductase subunit M
LAHTEAPTAGSVLLAAVLLKLGTYGLLRFALPMCPDAMLTCAPFIATLCIIGIIYAALVCWVQRDVKKLIAYSSVSHLGFCVLGLVALNNIGISGSILYMINHGLSTGALFLCIDMVYERFHTRSIDELGGLARRMPIWTTFTIFFVMASVGLPGLNGFIGEFMTILGAFVSGQTSGSGAFTPGTLGPWYAAVAAIGMILAAIYLLYFAGTLVFGHYHNPFTNASHHNDAHHGHPLPRDLSLREITVLAPLAVLCLVLGVRPGIILDPIADSVNNTVTHIAEHLQRTIDVAMNKQAIERSVP